MGVEGMGIGVCNGIRRCYLCAAVCCRIPSDKGIPVPGGDGQITIGSIAGDFHSSRGHAAAVCLKRHLHIKFAGSGDSAVVGDGAVVGDCAVVGDGAFVVDGTIVGEDRTGINCKHIPRRNRHNGS